MVLSVLFKFDATALTYVGHYAGPCLIQLNGQAIVICRENGLEINKWPYNCIRQFRAEDETGKFSFVSGRRGPWGVAEYNFGLSNSSLVSLQSALTEFTGAQFSAVAPGSGTEQQPLQMQQPLPPYPPTMPRHASVGSVHAYSTSSSTPQPMIGGGSNRVNSTSSSDVFPSSRPQNVPKLPPRDYIMTNSPHDQVNLSNSTDDFSRRNNYRTRAATSGSLSSSTSPEANRPFLPPPYPGSKESSPETWVAKGTNYEEAQITNLKANVQTPVKQKKKSFFDRFRGSNSGSTGGDDESESKHTKKQRKNSAEDESSLDSPIVTRQQTLRSEKKSQDKLHDSSPKRLSGEESKIHNGSKKESPYDHLPSEKDQELAQVNNTDANEVSLGHDSPDSPGGKQSPYLEEVIEPRPRSSPTITGKSSRPITPEHAQGGRVSKILRGRVSPPTKQIKKYNTMTSFSAHHAQIDQASDLYNVPRPVESDHTSLYNVPRQATATDLYNVPKSVMESPPECNRIGEADNMYATPRPVNQSNLDSVNGVRYSPQSDELYKVPSSVVAQNGTGMEHGVENMYNVPRPSQSSTPGSPTGKSKSNPMRNGDRPRLRPARSLESLSKLRINPPAQDDPKIFRGHLSPPASGRPSGVYIDIDLQKELSPTSSGHFSPPASGRPVGVYIDIDLQKELPPAKNAPLPPLPTPGGPEREVDSVYAEISEDAIIKSRIARSSKSSDGTVNPAYSVTKEALTQSKSSEMLALEGMAKAKELAEEEGYELFMPSRYPAAIPLSRCASDTPPQQTTASALLEKYKIDIHNSSPRLRPHSVSDILNDDAPNPSILGSSIPVVEDTSDEYVIVTGPDHRPKPNHTSPQTVHQNGSIPSSGVVEEDAYEVMNTARANLILNQSHYATPNPSLRTASFNKQVPMSTDSVPHQDVSPPLPPRLNSVEAEESISAGIDLDNMSPMDAPKSLGSSVQERRSLSLSVSSDQSEEAEGKDTSLQGHDNSPSAKLMLVKTFSGSPMDRSNSIELRNHTRSLGNVLEEKTTSSPQNSSNSPQTAKRHNYINYSPKEDEEIPPKERTTPIKKRPLPLPRSSLLRGESLTTDL